MDSIKRFIARIFGLYVEQIAPTPEPTAYIVLKRPNLIKEKLFINIEQSQQFRYFLTWFYISLLKDTTRDTKLEQAQVLDMIWKFQTYYTECWGNVKDDLLDRGFSKKSLDTA